ncbi:glycosyltransferase family 2 protein [Paraglaciecola sp. 2405UD69-4]|uniref:glycosyltransferase family 2 protein n=1 Tax=Paraglaciecola sp. 2405UD69-4 TaxID=3391836 RepID=UPI0039C91EFC
MSSFKIEKPVISVVVPVYNRKERLLVVLNSLLNQDITVLYEILVVDDGSSDGSTEAIENIDNKIRVIRQVNRGAAAARHCGGLNARGEIIIYHDSDDLALPNKLKVMSEALNRHPDCVAAVSISKNPDKKNWKLPYWAKKGDSSDVVFDNPLEHFFGNYYPLANAMNIAIRRDVALFSGAEMEHFKAANDYQLQFKAATKGKFVCVPVVTHEYHVGEGISSNFGQYVQEAFSLISMWDNFALLSSPEEFKHHVQRRSENDGPRIILMLLTKKKFSLAWQVMIKTVKYGRTQKFPSRIYWALEYYLKTKKARG